MMRDFLMPAAITSLSAIAIVTGLIVSGGPARGRAEMRDTTRVRQISDAAHHIRCLARQNENQLPETVAPHSNCPDRDLFTDPFSGGSFTYQVTDSRNFRICTTLELPEDQRRNYLVYGNNRSYDQDSGCFIFDYNP
ncbi:hypothetical protein [Halocynthiibacter styelae]|uniref:Uncharacterized protein n=1 Tax=Halocynthiibacter styelae TaxID=2761955 RepID=A0A8J7IWF8_9RHOB|nr:hypothetical protein [Paenihalocynthiibacter styelae]MBI1493624.1 hypothetical protein [Paenihalocynthiibacter styelae]